MSLLLGEHTHWLPSNRCDARAIALYFRHYSSEKSGRKPSVYRSGFSGNGEDMVLLTEKCDAVFAWLHNVVPRKDAQAGVNCTIFRNESPVLSSELIREADELAWERWPEEPRHFTYVNPVKIASINPGYCFKQAGWRSCGLNRDGHLVLLERTLQ